ncbi:MULTISPECIES: hypothetical protein [unclassified Streptomyces]|nr:MULTISPECIES: hypothetical protein [unclassified Streptomyces]
MSPRERRLPGLPHPYDLPFSGGIDPAAGTTRNGARSGGARYGEEL